MLYATYLIELAAIFSVTKVYNFSVTKLSPKDEIN